VKRLRDAGAIIFLKANLDEFNVSEPTLFRIAHAYEQVSRRRAAPKSTPHLEGEVFTY
jgi:Asp-tRNA(Asn)/Glu-tRNA(Gln) amidotransferase A subunit family amidase